MKIPERRVGRFASVKHVLLSFFFRFNLKGIEEEVEMLYQLTNKEEVLRHVTCGGLGKATKKEGRRERKVEIKKKRI